MSSSDPLVLTGVSSDNFAALCAKAKASGIALDGPSGESSYMGVTIAWNYEQATETLTLNCLSVPFFVSKDQVYSKLKAMVASVVG